MSSSPEKPVSVSVLTEAIRYSLNKMFNAVWVEGEVSGLSRPASGHLYFTLKDKTAQLNSILWRTEASRLPFDLKEGQKVICSGYIDLYAQRGNYQLIVKKVQPVGVGALQLAFQQLKEKLSREGLFDPAAKKTLPRYPKNIAVVTSPTGAAIRDFQQVLTRRWPMTNVLVVPVRVQGDGAAGEIASAVNSLQAMHGKIDVIVVTRGGGSIEDLWSFNDEGVCRAVFASKIPVISGVGHEIDVTLCDLVADVRALTPSEAAERLVPDRTVFGKQLANVESRMRGAVAGKIETARLILDRFTHHRRLTHPLEPIERRAMDVDDSEQRLHVQMQRLMESHRREVSRLAEKLELVSPLGILGRGYSLTTETSGAVVRSAKQVDAGDVIETKVADGTILSRVE